MLIDIDGIVSQPKRRTGHRCPVLAFTRDQSLRASRWIGCESSVQYCAPQESHPNLLPSLHILALPHFWQRPVNVAFVASTWTAI
jgi:hypothetical protein